MITQGRNQCFIAACVICCLLTIGCNDSGGDGGNGGSSEEPSAQTYKVYVGEVENYNTQPIQWKWKKELGTGNGDTEFDLAAIGETWARDIEIVSDGKTVVDAAENLQTGATIGFHADGTSAGFSMHGGTNSGPAGIAFVGKPDGLGGHITLTHPLTFRCGGSSCSFVDTDLSDGPGNDLKIYTAQTLFNLPYEGTGPNITDSDVIAIRNIMTDLETGYETKNKALILQHIADPIKANYEHELDAIFTHLSGILIVQYSYKISGKLPYVLIENNEPYDWAFDMTLNPPTNCGTSWGNALFFFFQKENDQWKTYWIPPINNWHAVLVDCAYRKAAGL